MTTSDAAGFATLEDAALAAALAAAAGRLLLDLRSSRQDRAGLGDEGDRVANRFLVNALHAARPQDGLLSEEMGCDGTRLAHSRVWIVDPVDGTREYAEGRDDWAVHVALVVDGIATTGAVALPAKGLVLRSDRPQLLPPLPTRPRIVVSRTRPPAEAAILSTALGAELVPMGSAGAKAMAVARGTAEIYLHLGGQCEWDSAAPVAVASAYGLHCSRVDGAPLRYNAADVIVPDLLICRRELAAPAIAALAACA